MLIAAGMLALFKFGGISANVASIGNRQSILLIIAMICSSIMLYYIGHEIPYSSGFGFMLTGLLLMIGIFMLNTISDKNNGLLKAAIIAMTLGICMSVAMYLY